MMSRRNFLQQMYPTHAIGPQTHVLGRFGPFHYYTNFSGKQAKLVSLMHKIVQRRCVGIFRIERTRSTPLDPKLMFWCISNRSVTTQTLVQNEAKLAPLVHKFVQRSRIQIFCNAHTGSTPLDPKFVFWGVSDRFVTA
jgi:hypothetical protein